MHELEQLIGLFVAAVALAALARRVGAPYPVFLAIGGAGLALLPIQSTFSLPPELALALFVAPVLLDAAFDSSLRDLRDNWLPVTGLVVFAVGLTTLAVAAVVRALVPEMPWAAAIALGAVVAPPDAVSASAVLRPLRPPHRILTVLEGESLLNDATALLILRLAITAVAADGVTFGDVAPTFLLGVVGSLVAGPAMGWVTLWLLDRVRHVPTAIILQFVTTFSVWMIAERVGLSGVLTMVSYTIMVARVSPGRTPARVRIPTYAVWETVVFALNILAFIFIGLQLRPIVGSLSPNVRGQYVAVAAAVLVTVIVVRLTWQLSVSAVTQWWHRRFGFTPPRPMLRPSFKSALIVAWAGMRGIVSLAAALALPAAFPHRDLVVLTAFAVVLGTLVIHGLTLGPLLRCFDLRDGDPVGREVRTARDRTLAAALATLDGDQSDSAMSVRRELAAHLGGDENDGPDADGESARHHDLHARATHAARQVLLTMRADEEIGDDAFHRVEEQLDWLDMR
mgnify:CR=1 FL=1